jgi:hypothetical protein
MSKITEKIFDKQTASDTKKIINRLNREIDSSILEKIERGVTVEELDQMIKTGLPVFKYHTQITIHGLFPELQNDRVFGYKNLFQNKNKSIGVKYNAIDEEKRQRIAERMNCLGFYYRRDSSSTGFELSNRITQENAEELKRKYLALKDRVDTSLFSGNISIYVMSSWLGKTIHLNIAINTIYEKNIEPFLNKLGATKQVLFEKQESERLEAEANREKEKVRKELALKMRREEEERKADQLNLLKTLPKIEPTIPGLYVSTYFDYENKLVFEATKLFYPERAKKMRYQKKGFDSIFDAVLFEPNSLSSHNIFSGRKEMRFVPQELTALLKQ